MLGIHVCAANARHTRMYCKFCNAVFSPISLGVWGVQRDLNSLKLLCYCLSVDGLFAALVSSPLERSKVSVSSLTIQSFMHLMNMRSVVPKCFCEFLHLS